MEEIVGCGDFDDKKVICITPEICNIPKISINPEDFDYIDLQAGTDEKARDSDIKVELAYEIIDTFNVFEENTFTQEGGQSSRDTSLNIRHQNDQSQTPIKVEVDNQTEKDYLDYETLNLERDLNTNITQPLQRKGM